MTIKNRLKRLVIMLLLGLPILYWTGTTLLKDIPDLLRLTVYFVGWWVFDWIAKKLLRQEVS